MPRYKFQFAYTPEAWAALSKNPVDRREGVRQLFEKLGAKLIDLYYCFGEFDGVAIVEAPDNASYAGGILATLAPGHIKSAKTTVLLTVEETMDAMRKAGGLSYQAPSGR